MPLERSMFDGFFLFADGFDTDDCHEDLDRNGVVDLNDFFIFADNFGLVAAADCGGASSEPSVSSI